MAARNGMPALKYYTRHKGYIQHLRSKSFPVKILLATLFCFMAFGVSAQNLIDTTYHDNGRVATVSWYRVRLTKELTRAEAFQRGLMYGVGADTLFLRDSVLAWDTEGRPTEDLELINGSRLRTRSGNPAEPSRSNSQELRTRWIEDLPTRLEGYIGRLSTDTVQLTHLPPGIKYGPLRLQLTGGGLQLDTILYTHQKPSVPVRFVPGTEEQTALLTVTGEGGGESFKQPITVVGYDLKEVDFAVDPNEGRVVSLRRGQRQYLLLQLGTAEKLLSIRSGEVAYGSHPVGRLRDAISIEEWPAGSYSLRLRDLRTGGERFATLELE